MKTLIQKISSIQNNLKAPKNQFNKFGGYKYRSCEDILEAVKPLLNQQGLILTISDDITELSGRFYIKSTATITDGENSISNSAFARESDTKKGMDESQITGSASSYARKYALNGLFAIDDTKDADATNTHGKASDSVSKAAQTKRQNALSFEDRFLKMYQFFKSPNLKWSYVLEENFLDIMKEAEKRHYDVEKQTELWTIFNALEKDSLPNFDDKE